MELIIENIKNNIIPIVGTSIATLLLSAFISHYKWRRSLPPMVGFTLPYFGNPLKLRKIFSSNLSEFLTSAANEINSDIISLYGFGQTYVFCLSYESFKECMIRNGAVTSGRPMLGSFNEELLAVTRGLVNSEGEIWQNHRQVIIRALKDISLDSSALFQKITEESSVLLQKLSELPANDSKELMNILQDTTSSIISQLVFGHRFEKVEILRKLLTINEDILEEYLKFDIKRFIPGAESNVNKLAEQRLRPIVNYIDNEIKLHENSEEADDDVISIILQKRNVLPKMFQLKDVVAIVLDLFFAGTKTTSDTLGWAFYHLKRHPEIQELVREELNEVLGNRPLKYKDIEKLPKFVALVHEVMRITPVVEVTVLHRSVQPFELMGYKIPKSTVLAGVHTNILHDSQNFKSGKDFNIKNFLNPDMTKFVLHDMITFGLGPRRCLGERLAKFELYIFLSTVLQNYKIEPLKDGSDSNEAKYFASLKEVAVKFTPIL